MKLERIELLHVVLLGGVALATVATGWLHAGSVLLGGVLMAVNFWVLKRLVQRALRPGNGRAGALMLLSSKFLLLLGVIAIVLPRVPFDPASFAVGVTMLLAACTIEALRANSAISTEGTV